MLAAVLAAEVLVFVAWDAFDTRKKAIKYKQSCLTTTPMFITPKAIPLDLNLAVSHKAQSRPSLRDVRWLYHHDGNVYRNPTYNNAGFRVPKWEWVTLDTNRPTPPRSRPSPFPTLGLTPSEPRPSDLAERINKALRDGQGKKP